MEMFKNAVTSVKMVAILDVDWVLRTELNISDHYNYNSTINGTELYK